jgi:hypothetical protein
MGKRKETTLLVVHVTATPPSADIGVKEVRVMHLARGFSDIGYHYVIRRNGKVEAGRAEDEIGAHVQGHNSNSIGVSMVGGVNAAGKPENNATPAQLIALEALLKKLQLKYPKAGVCGHRDLSPDKDGDGIIEPFEHIKACPCFDVIPWAQARGLRPANIKGVWYRQAAAPAPLTVKQDNAMPPPAPRPVPVPAQPKADWSDPAGIPDLDKPIMKMTTIWGAAAALLTSIVNTLMSLPAPVRYGLLALGVAGIVWIVRERLRRRAQQRTLENA